MKKRDKIYVAGHRGLAGSAIVRVLIRAGYQNIVVKDRSDLDLRDQQAVTDFFDCEKPDHVFLAAARVGGIYANKTFPADFIHDNLSIQTNVFHSSYRCGVKRVLFLGSSCIYPKFAPQPMSESCLMTGPLEPTNQAYAMAKIAGIHMCWAYNQQHKTRFIPVMPTNLYGPGDTFDLLNAHVLPALMRKFHLAKLASGQNWSAIEKDEHRFGAISDDIKKKLGLPGRQPLSSTQSAPAVVLWGTGAPKREFLFSDDLAEAVLLLMETPWSVLTASTLADGPFLFNIGTGKDLSIRALAGEVARVVDYQGPIEWDAGMPDGAPRKLLDVSVMDKIGWRARTSLDDGLRRTYAWYNAQSTAGGPEGRH